MQFDETRMVEHGYETGRLDLPFVGICTFGKYPICLDWNEIRVGVTVLGARFDAGTQWHAGTHFGPRSVREASSSFPSAMPAHTIMEAISPTCRPERPASPIWSKSRLITIRPGRPRSWRRNR